jgi:predicted molibdopterin-dependent oxidoreductase YjgC
MTTMLKEKKGIILTIDDNETFVPNGTTILEAARKAGIRIPTLCYHPALAPIGSCRICIVEIEGVDRPATACNTEVLEGMKVTTRSERLFNLRREVIKMILAHHPLNCAPCPKNGDCELQDLAYEYDLATMDFNEYRIQAEEFPWKPFSTPILDYHPRRCVLCGRCVKVCTEIRGLGAITIEGSGAKTVIQPVMTDEKTTSHCISCGECMRVCPVNAIEERMGGVKGKPWETKKVQTTCAYCGVGCQLELNVVNDRVVGVTTRDDIGVNKGRLCSKGRFGYTFIHSEDRLLRPMIRNKNGELEETTWTRALTYVAREFRRIKNESGPDSLAGLSSARSTNEENYLFQRLIRQVFGTNNVDHCARL